MEPSNVRPQYQPYLLFSEEVYKKVHLQYLYLKAQFTTAPPEDPHEMYNTLKYIRYWKFAYKPCMYYSPCHVIGVFHEDYKHDTFTIDDEPFSPDSIRQDITYTYCNDNIFTTDYVLLALALFGKELADIQLVSILSHYHSMDELFYLYRSPWHCIMGPRKRVNPAPNAT